MAKSKILTPDTTIPVGKEEYSAAIWRELRVLPDLLAEGEYVVEMDMAWNRLPGLLAVTNKRIIFLRKGLLLRSRMRVLSISLSDVFRVGLYPEKFGTSQIVVELAKRRYAFSQLSHGERAKGMVAAMHTS